MNPEPLFPDGGRVGVESLEDRAVMPGRRFMGIFAVVQEDPCPVFIPNTYVDMGWLEIKFPGADDELVLAYDGHRYSPSFGWNASKICSAPTRYPSQRNGVLKSFT